MFENLDQRFEHLGTAVEFDVGQALFQQGQPASGAYLLRGGTVCVSLADDSGMPVWSRMVHAGAVIGLAATVAGQRHELTAVAVQRSTLRHLDREKITAIIQNDPTAAAEILAVLSSEVAELGSKMALLLATCRRPAVEPNRRSGPRRTANIRTRWWKRIPLTNYIFS